MEKIHIFRLIKNPPPFVSITPGFEIISQKLFNKIKLDFKKENKKNKEGGVMVEILKKGRWAVVLLFLFGCESKAPKERKEVTTPSGLKYKDLKVGKGMEAKQGDVVVVHYTGWLEDNTKFDSSKDRGRPFEFRLGEGKVIKGWEEGVVGMRVGGKRRLVIPPELGYGEMGVPGVIPSNAKLIFEIELLKIKK